MYSLVLPWSRPSSVRLLTYFRFLLQPHSKQETEYVETPDQQVIDCHYGGKGGSAYYEIFQRDTHTPLNYKEADDEYYRLVQYIEWQHCLIGISQKYIIKVEIPAAKAENGHNEKP